MAQLPKWMDLNYLVFTPLGTVTEALIHSNQKVIFWLIVLGSGYFISYLTAFLVLAGSCVSFLASCNRPEHPLPLYKGALDILLGRSYCVSQRSPTGVANNNVSIIAFAEKLVVAYRNADSHFASPLAKLIVVTASLSNPEEWTEVWSYQTGEDDLREMLLFQLGGHLFVYFVKLAPHKRGFAPRRVHWSHTEDLQVWSAPEAVGRVSEITWDIKVRREGDQEVAYKTGYVGNHYASDAELSVLFEKSTDGKSWNPVGEESTVYIGGVSEVSFAFTEAGDLVAIGRNEDGDASGFGSQLFFARRDELGKWAALKISLPHRFDSPRLTCIRGELLLFARYAREPYAITPPWVPMKLQRVWNLLRYSTFPKSGAVYCIVPPDAADAACSWGTSPLRLVRCFEETYGDTGFFSVAEDAATGDYFVANYASHCVHSHSPWIYGQVKETEVRVCRCQIRLFSSS